MKKKKEPNHDKNEDNIGRNTEGNKEGGWVRDSKDPHKKNGQNEMKITRNTFLSLVWKW